MSMRWGGQMQRSGCAGLSGCSEATAATVTTRVVCLLGRGIQPCVLDRLVAAELARYELHAVRHAAYLHSTCRRVGDHHGCP